MSWNYRVLRYADGGYGLHEVYYNEEGEPDGWTDAPISFTCDDDEGPAGLVKDLARAIADARRYPVLQVKGNDLIAVGGNVE